MNKLLLTIVLTAAACFSYAVITSSALNLPAGSYNLNLPTTTCTSGSGTLVNQAEAIPFTVDANSNACSNGICSKLNLTSNTCYKVAGLVTFSSCKYNPSTNTVTIGSYSEILNNGYICTNTATFTPTSNNTSFSQSTN